MGDLPRWVASETYDSSAAVMAYLKWHAAKHPGKPHVLWEKVRFRKPGTLHDFAQEVNLEIPSKKRAGAGGNCQRCRIGLGGFQFRWVHWEWAADYDAAARPGALTSAEALTALVK